MENYVKAALYAYPSIENMEEAYAQHVKNKALLSCDGRMNTEKLAEYLAEEILRKRSLEWLKTIIKEAVDSLTEVERTLIGIAFFGTKKKVRLLSQKRCLGGAEWKSWSERSRFRIQTRALGKVKAAFLRAGLNKEVFEREFLSMEFIRRIYKRVLRSRGYSSVS